MSVYFAPSGLRLPVAPDIPGLRPGLLHPAPSGLRLAILAPILVLVADASAAPDEKIEWLTDYQKGVEAAQAEKKPLLLDFWAEW